MGDNDLVHYAATIDSLSNEELKLALLRAIDHARRSIAEVAEQRAVLDGTLYHIDELRRENLRLTDQLSSRRSRR